MLKATEHGAVVRFDLSRSILGRGRYWTAAYLVDGMMVDTGGAYSARELVRALDAVSLSRIVNTHSHEDHIGANGMLQQESAGLEILAHPLALPVMAAPRDAQPLHPYRRLLWGYPEPCVGHPIADGQVIETADYRFRVIYSPGHSPDHICLYEPERGWLFSGDLFVGGSDRALRADYDIWKIIAALRQAASLPLTMLFPGSARVRGSPADELNSKAAYLEDVGDRVAELHRKGWDVPAIARKVCGGPMFIELFTLGHFSRRRLVDSYLTHGPA